MFYPGLVSITFRSLSPQEIVALVRQAGLTSIEWGGDIHVPHGDLTRAREVRSLMDHHGLTTAAYGSYYRVGEEPPFEPVLEAAEALGAPLIRVWSGTLGSADADATYRAQVVTDLRRICTMAAERNIVIATEFHRGTLTDAADSLLTLFQAVDHPNLRTYWQPSVDRPDAECLIELERIAPWLSHLHAYQWQPGTTRRPLSEGRERWRAFLNAVRPLPGDRHVLLEFVEKDDPAAFLQDAATLKELLGEINQSAYTS